MTMHPYSSKLLASGFELQSDGGEPLSVCESAEWTGVGEGYTLEIDHTEGTGILVVEKIVPDPVDGMPVMFYEVDNDLHAQIQSENFRGISPVIEVQEVNDQTNKFTKYRIDGISFQFEAAPVCPDDFCPTEYQGGDRVDKDEEIVEEDKDEETTETVTTEEPPKKVVKKKVVKTPAKDVVEAAKASSTGGSQTQAEAIAELIRKNDALEAQLKVVSADLETREAVKRKELIESIPEEHREFAEKLEADALLAVAGILTKEKAAAKADKDATTIVDAGAVETTDQKKKSEETGDETKEKDPEEEERDFFDMSGVFEVSEEKSGIWAR